MKVPLPTLWKESLRRRFANWSAIAMLHRVDRRDPGRLIDNEALKISPELLEAFIVTARRSRWAFLSMDELTDSLAHGRVPRKSIALTLDDGYQDNLTIAAPVFRSYVVPYCVYVTTGLVEGSTKMWWYQLEAVVQNCEAIDTPDGMRLSCSDGPAKRKAFAIFKKNLMSADPATRTEAQRWLLEKSLGLDQVVREENPIMNWDEVIKLSMDPLATVGAHTVSHPVLKSLDEAAVALEMLQSKRDIEARIQMPVRHFAYPFGGDTAAGPREFRLAMECGFRSAVTTRSDRIRSAPAATFDLPRLNFTDDLDEGIGAVFGTKSIRRAFERRNSRFG